MRFLTEAQEAQHPWPAALCVCVCACARVCVKHWEDVRGSVCQRLFDKMRQYLVSSCWVCVCVCVCVSCGSQPLLSCHSVPMTLHSHLDSPEEERESVNKHRRVHQWVKHLRRPPWIYCWSSHKRYGWVLRVVSMSSVTIGGQQTPNTADRKQWIKLHTLNMMI